MRIFLDDVREIPNGYLGARNFEEFKKVYKENLDKIEEISLDHDLGQQKTGYDACLWLVENNYFNNLKKITIHSANPVGIKNMTQLLDRYAPKEIEIYYLDLKKNVIRYYRNNK